MDEEREGKEPSRRGDLSRAFIPPCNCAQTGEAGDSLTRRPKAGTIVTQSSQVARFLWISFQNLHRRRRPAKRENALRRTIYPGETQPKHGRRRARRVCFGSALVGAKRSSPTRYVGSYTGTRSVSECLVQPPQAILVLAGGGLTRGDKGTGIGYGLEGCVSPAGAK